MWILCLWNIGNETFLFSIEIYEDKAEQYEYADNSCNIDNGTISLMTVYKTPHILIYRSHGMSMWYQST